MTDSKTTYNREKGEWPLTVGDQTFTMKLTTNAMAELEDFTERLGIGKTWDEIVVGLIRGKVSDCRLFIWAAMRAFHADVATGEVKDVGVKGSPKLVAPGLARIGDLIDEAGGLTAIHDQIKAFVQNNAKPEESGDRPPAAGPETAPGPAAKPIDGTGAARTPRSSRSA